MNYRNIALILVALASSTVALATVPAKHSNLDKNAVALKGYDPVSYFTASKPVQGNDNISVTHDDAVYRFASQDNRSKFQAEPAKYLPEYGGWCAKAIADKEKVDIDPLNYKITNGRLFLFYKGLWGDALNIWNKDEANLTRRADENWKQIVAE
jgi:hypothetical protein